MGLTIYAWPPAVFARSSGPHSAVQVLVLQIASFPLFFEENLRLTREIEDCAALWALGANRRLHCPAQSAFFVRWESKIRWA